MPRKYRDAFLIFAFHIASAVPVDLNGSSQCPAGDDSCAATSSVDPETTRCNFSEILSAREDFPQNAPTPYFPGMHAICIWRDGAGMTGHSYVGAVSGHKVVRFNLPAKSLQSLSAFRKNLAKSLNIKKKTNDWGHLDLKQDYGLFTSNGTRLESLKEVLRSTQMLLMEGGQWVWPPVRLGYIRQVADLTLETLSLQPIVFGLQSFLRKDEQEQLVKHSAGKMAASGVLRRDAAGYRTSNDTRLESWEHDFLPPIDDRVEMITRMPKVYHEEIQVAHFQRKQYYAFHADAYDPAVHKPDWVRFIDHGHRNRFATMLWYLSSVKKGGETMFPLAGGLAPPDTRLDDGRDVCGTKQGFKVKPKPGNAIIFYNLHPNGNFDYLARHAGCPPRSKDGKWAANKWIWNKPTPQRNSRS